MWEIGISALQGRKSAEIEDSRRTRLDECGLRSSYRQLRQLVQLRPQLQLLFSLYQRLFA